MRQLPGPLLMWMRPNSRLLIMYPGITLEQIPTPDAVPRPSRTIPALGSPASRIKQGPHGIKPVSGHQPAGHQFPQGLLHFRRQMSCSTGQIRKKTCTTTIQAIPNGLCHATQMQPHSKRPCRCSGFGHTQDPTHILPAQKTNGRQPGRSQWPECRNSRSSIYGKRACSLSWPHQR